MASFGFDKQITATVKTPTTEQDASLELDHLMNEKYERLLKDYIFCNLSYMTQFGEWFEYEKELKRRDIDTVCAYELYQMKKEFTQSKVLDLSSFVAHNEWANRKQI